MPATQAQQHPSMLKQVGYVLIQVQSKHSVVEVLKPATQAQQHPCMLKQQLLHVNHVVVGLQDMHCVMVIPRSTSQAQRHPCMLKQQLLHFNYVEVVGSQGMHCVMVMPVSTYWVQLHLCILTQQPLQLYFKDGMKRYKIAPYTLTLACKFLLGCPTQGFPEVHTKQYIRECACSNLPHTPGPQLCLSAQRKNPTHSYPTGTVIYSSLHAALAPGDGNNVVHTDLLQQQQQQQQQQRCHHHSSVLSVLGSYADVPTSALSPEYPREVDTLSGVTYDI
eukprot:1150982-Pelagomonas_calceolata.AAC.3